MKSFLGALVMGCLFATSGTATTVDVFESNAPGGDYANMLGASTNNLGSVPVGSAYIFGDLTAPNDVFDGLFFTIDDGTELVSSSIMTEGDSVAMNAELLDDTGSSIFSITFFSNMAVDLIMLMDAPLAAGTYNLGLSMFSRSGDEQVFWVTESQVVSTSPVPLPASLPLLAVGLALAGFAGRRRKS